MAFPTSGRSLLSLLWSLRLHRLDPSLGARGPLLNRLGSLVPHSSSGSDTRALGAMSPGSSNMRVRACTGSSLRLVDSRHAS